MHLFERYDLWKETMVLLKQTIVSLNVMRDFDPSDFDMDFDIFFMRIGRSVRPARRQRIDHHNGKGEDSLICLTYR